MTEPIHGMAASKGKVTGKARVIFSDKDIYRVNNGEIIVSKFTNPNFLLALYKAKAIVTDSGGLTAHAAIVARELGIPCVTGTKNATKLIKTGDSILVDGSEGLVYRL